jgi:hypothetical protein
MLMAHLKEARERDEGHAENFTGGESRGVAGGALGVVDVAVVVLGRGGPCTTSAEPSTGRRGLARVATGKRAFLP